MSNETIPQEIANVLLGVSNDPTIIFLIIILILLIVEIFMDMAPDVLIYTPIYLSIITKLGMDSGQFGMVMVLILCISPCTHRWLCVIC